MSITRQQQQNAQSSSNKQLSPAIVSWKQAEDRFLAWRLIERMLASITIEDNDMDELKDKQDALVRASKGIEESTRTPAAQGQQGPSPPPALCSRGQARCALFSNAIGAMQDKHFLYVLPANA